MAESNHNPQKYRRSLACAIHHLENAASNPPDGVNLAASEVTSAVNQLQQLWAMSAAASGIEAQVPGPPMELYG